MVGLNLISLRPSASGGFLEAAIKPATPVDHAVSFDFHKPRRIDEARNLDKGARGANVTKNLTMRGVLHRANCGCPSAIRKVTDAMVEIEGEAMRGVTWVRGA